LTCTCGRRAAVGAIPALSARYDILAEHETSAIANREGDARPTGIHCVTAQDDEPIDDGRLIDSVRLNRGIARKS
jgi:hypothetical protein